MLGRPDLRQHVERPGREPRQHPVAARAGDHRAQQERPASWCGRTTRSRTASCTASGPRRRSARSAACVQVVSAQGDGWVRGYEAQTGKKLWEFDTNPKDSVWPRTRNEVIATPVIYRGPRLHRQRPGPRARRRRRPLLRHRRDQARRHHAERARLALRQDPPLDLDGRRSPTASSTSPTSAASCTASTPKTGQEYWTHDLLRRRLGLAVRRRRQGLPRRRGRRRRRPAARQGEEGAGRDEHGQRRLRDGRRRPTARSSSTTAISCSRSRTNRIASAAIS